VEQFVACWDELDDPRTGNAARHDFNELLIIAFCAVCYAEDRARLTWCCLPGQKTRSCTAS
jgi:hypothetical protein